MTVTCRVCFLILAALGRIKADRCTDRNIPGVTTEKVRSFHKIERITKNGGKIENIQAKEQCVREKEMKRRGQE